MHQQKLRYDKGLLDYYIILICLCKTKIKETSITNHRTFRQFHETHTTQGNLLEINKDFTSKAVPAD